MRAQETAAQASSYCCYLEMSAYRTALKLRIFGEFVEFGEYNACVFDGSLQMLISLIAFTQLDINKLLILEVSAPLSLHDSVDGAGEVRIAVRVLVIYRFLHQMPDL